MKKLLSLLAIALFVVSCSGDDDGGDSTDVGLAGTYNLTGYTFDEAVDVNLDGTASTDFFAELPCFTAVATFNANGSFTSVTDEIVFDITPTGATVDCGDPESNTGTWSLSGNQLTVVSDGDTDVQEITLTASTITYEIADPDFGLATWVWTRQ